MAKSGTMTVYVRVWGMNGSFDGPGKYLTFKLFKRDALNDHVKKSLARRFKLKIVSDTIVGDYLSSENRVIGKIHELVLTGKLWDGRVVTHTLRHGV